ncbi:MAG TPA: energy transducer TonB [Acidobacteriota bacterium]|nr:energy transducer TonB [Acidobacteriota bacterium]
MSELNKRHPLRRRYYRRVRTAFVAALAAHGALFIFAPPYRPNPPVMRPDPIRLVPAGEAFRASSLTPVAVAAPEGGIPDESRIPPAPAAVRAAVDQEIRSEQWQEPRSAPAGGSAGGAEGRLESEAPPVYYGYEVAPRATRTFEPEYPAAARNSGFEGTVVINVNLDERGRILRAWVASANAPEILVATSLDAVYQFEFTPGLARGVPIRSTVAIPFRFTLRRTT